jgi:hypothetical protein
MDRQSWTEEDQRIAHREGAAWYLWREILQPARYREHTPQVRPSHMAQARGKHVAPDPDDEEPSQEGVTVSVVYITRQRRRPTTLQVLVLGGMGVAVVTVGYLAVRSLMGAS